MHLFYKKTPQISWECLPFAQSKTVKHQNWGKTWPIPRINALQWVSQEVSIPKQLRVDFTWASPSLPFARSKTPLQCLRHQQWRWTKNPLIIKKFFLRMRTMTWINGFLRKSKFLNSWEQASIKNSLSVCQTPAAEMEKNLNNQKEFLHLKTADACAMRITHGSRGRQQIYLCCMKLKTLPIPEFNVECIKNPIRRRKIDYKANNADKFTPIMARPLPIPNQGWIFFRPNPRHGPIVCHLLKVGRFCWK